MPSHWILIAVNRSIDQSSAIASVYDSLDHSLESYHTYVNMCIDIAKRIKFCREGANIQTRVVDVPKQRDASNCGVYVCWFIKHLSSGQSIPSHSLNTLDFRKEIGDGLIELYNQGKYNGIIFKRTETDEFRKKV
jgi:Ulp1 family protease